MADIANELTGHIEWTEIEQVAEWSHDPALLKIRAQAIEAQFRRARHTFRAELDFVAFMENVDVREGECWHWLGLMSSNGYPLLARNAHRISAAQVMLATVDRYGSGKQIIVRRCGYSGCMNPDHLFWGTFGQAKMLQRVERTRRLAWDHCLDESGNVL